MIYLLHSTVSLGGTGRAGAKHYLGSCLDDRLETRLHEHLSGKSQVKIVQAFLENGATLVLARTWPDGTRALERYLKKNGHFSDLCPICRRENGLPPIRTPGTVPMASLPVYVSRLRRRTTESGGALSPGNRTSSTGASQAELDLGITTSSPGAPTPSPASGGISYAVTAPQRQPTGESAGTKLPSGSVGRTSGNAPKEDLIREVDRRP